MLVDGGVEIRAEAVSGVPELLVELLKEGLFFGSAGSAGAGHGRVGKRTMGNNGCRLSTSLR